MWVVHKYSCSQLYLAFDVANDASHFPGIISQIQFIDYIHVTIQVQFQTKIMVQKFCCHLISIHSHNWVSRGMFALPVAVWTGFATYCQSLQFIACAKQILRQHSSWFAVLRKNALRCWQHNRAGPSEGDNYYQLVKKKILSISWKFSSRAMFTGAHPGPCQVHAVPSCFGKGFFFFLAYVAKSPNWSVPPGFQGH